MIKWLNDFNINILILRKERKPWGDFVFPSTQKGSQFFCNNIESKQFEVIPSKKKERRVQNIICQVQKKRRKKKIFHIPTLNDFFFNSTSTSSSILFFSSSSSSFLNLIWCSSFFCPSSSSSCDCCDCCDCCGCCDCCDCCDCCGCCDCCDCCVVVVVENLDSSVKMKLVVPKIDEYYWTIQKELWELSWCPPQTRTVSFLPLFFSPSPWKTRTLALALSKSKNKTSFWCPFRCLCFCFHICIAEPSSKPIFWTSFFSSFLVPPLLKFFEERPHFLQKEGPIWLHSSLFSRLKNPVICEMKIGGHLHLHKSKYFFLILKWKKNLEWTPRYVKSGSNGGGGGEWCGHWGLVSGKESPQMKYFQGLGPY